MNDVFLSLSGAATLSFSTCISLLVIMSPVARRLGLVDRPGSRKQHVGDIPIIGGYALIGAVIVGTLVLGRPTQPVLVYILVATYLVVVNSINDHHRISAPLRLLVQIGAVLAMVFGADVMLSNLGDPFATGQIRLGTFALVTTTLVSVFIVAAFSVFDSMDGLCASMALSASIGLLAVSMISGNSDASSVVLVFAAALIGFLISNSSARHKNSHRTFLGAAGSTFVGFTVIWFGFTVIGGSTVIVPPVVVLWFVAVPAIDLMTVFVKRNMRARSPFVPGRDHLHHRLIRAGFSPGVALGILSASSAVFTAFGLLGFVVELPDVVMFMAFVVSAAAFIVSMNYGIVFARAYYMRRLRE